MEHSPFPATNGPEPLIDDNVRRLDRALSLTGRARSADGRLSPDTMRQYRAIQERYRRWCRDGRRREFPDDTRTSGEQLGEYAVELLRSGYATTTVRLHMAAVKSWFRERGKPLPDGLPAWFVVRGAHGSTDGTGGDAPPRRAVLMAIAAVCDLATPAGVRDSCLAMLGWDVMASVRQLVGLDVADLTRTDTGGYAVRIRGGVVAVEHDHRPAPDVCPVCAADRWLSLLRDVGVTAGPLFRPVDKVGRIGGVGAVRAGSTAPDGRLAVRGLRVIWSRLVVRAGLPREASTPSALRAGGAADAVNGGVPVRDVVNRGGWSPHTARVAARLADVGRDQVGQ